MSDFFFAMQSHRGEKISNRLPVILVVASLITALIHNEIGVCPCALNIINAQNQTMKTKLFDKCVFFWVDESSSAKI